MRTRSIKSLELGKALQANLYHHSGEVLLRKGVMIDPMHVELLHSSGIDSVFAPEERDDISEFVFLAKNVKLLLTDLEDNVALSKPIYEANGALLVEAGVKISKNIVDNFLRRGINHVYIHRDAKELKLSQVDSFLEKLYKWENKIEDVVVELEEKQIARPEDISISAIEEIIKVPTSLRIKKSGDALSKQITRNEFGNTTSDQKKKAYIDLHQQALDGTREVMTAIADSKNVDGRVIGMISQRVISGLVDNCDALLNLSLVKPSKDEYLVGHIVNVTILAIAIGTALGYNKHQILELSYGAFLHDVGMIKVPRPIVDQNRPLTRQECMDVKRHSIYGVNILEKISGIPVSTPFIAYQCHEREDGSGYPKGRQGFLIHDYAKIVAVADIYEALTSDRPYRPGKTPYEAMETIIRMAGKGLLDSSIVRAFLRYMSLFPIGSWVKLSDERKAKVVGVNEANYERPIVCVFEGGSPVERINLMKNPDVRVTRVIDGRLMDAGLMDGF